VFSTVSALVDDLSANYDNTDLATVQDSTVRENKYTSYVNRLYNQLWYRRDWRWTYGTKDPLTMSSGTASYPTDYAGIGNQGGLYDAEGNPWRRIAYQDVESLRARGVSAQSKLFSLGPSTIIIPNTASSANFRFVYRKTPATLNYTQGTALAPMPPAFVVALHAGVVARVKEEEGDTRPEWRADFLQALSEAFRVENQGSEAQQMPMAVGGMW